MNLDTYPMPPDVRKQAKRLLDQIQKAEAAIEAVRIGGVAEGFVLGMGTLKAIPEDTLENMDVLFSKATDERLRVLGG